MHTIKLGIIGPGVHMKSHITGLADVQNIEISAIVDPKILSIDEILDPRYKGEQGKVEKLLSGAKIYRREEEMYESGEVNAIMSGTPDKFHLGNLILAVQNGVHAMIEKPLATKQEDCSELARYLKLAEEKKLVLSSCHIRRFDPPFLWLKSNLNRFKEEMGDILNTNYDFSYIMPSHEKKGLHQGLLMDHFNHEIDLLNFLFGYKDFKATKFYDDENRYNVGGIRKDDIAFNFMGTRMLNNKEYPEFIEIRFERGTLKLYTKNGHVEVHNHDKNIFYTEQADAVDYIKRLKGVNNNFINSILLLEKNYLTAKELFLNTSSSINLTYKGSYDSSKDEILNSL